MRLTLLAIFVLSLTPLHALGQAFFKDNDHVECRIEEEGEVFYGDLSESMCAHLGGLNMDAQGFMPNPNYSGEISESKYLFTPLMIDKALGREKDPQADLKKIVQCQLVDGDEVIKASLSRFMCKHLAGEEITTQKYEKPVVSQIKKQKREKSKSNKSDKEKEIECRIEDEGELFYADMTRFMCNHLSGTVLDDLKLPKNPNYNGSIHSSRFLDSHPKAVVKCHLQDGDDEITGDLSRFMCNHLGGTIIGESKSGGNAETRSQEAGLEESFDDLSGQ